MFAGCDTGKQMLSTFSTAEWELAQSSLDALSLTPARFGCGFVLAGSGVPGILAGVYV